jgi:hypothetical protein
MNDDDDDKGGGGDDGGRAAAYANPEPNKNLVSFELPGDDLDDDGYFQKLTPAFERLGRPKHPSEYKWSDDPELGLTPDDVGYRDHMARVFHRIGATQRQVRQLEKAQLEYIKTQRDGHNVKRSTAAQRAKGELSKEGGGETSSRIAMANRAFKEHAGRDASVLAQLELNDGTPLSSHPAFVRMLANVGASTPARGGGRSAEEELERMTKEALDKGLDPTSKRWPHKELQKLYDEVYGSEQLETSLDGGSGTMKRRR